MYSRMTIVSWMVLAASCADTHQGEMRCVGGGCEDDFVCLPDEGSVCVGSCDSTIMSRCDNGAVCWRYRDGGVCWPGRDVPEGEEPPFQYDCAFGLRPRGDYESEPLRSTCEPVCNVDADCRDGEVCSGTTCRAPCRNSAGEPCAATSYCVSGVVCVNERRFSRIDCDGDRDLDPECTVTLACDPEDPSRCLHVPPGEE